MLCLSFFLFFNCYLAQVTGLDGWDLFIDPGHSQDENMGINGYSEAKEALQVGLHLMDIYHQTIMVIQKWRTSSMRINSKSVGN